MYRSCPPCALLPINQLPSTFLMTAKHELAKTPRSLSPESFLCASRRLRIVALMVSAEHFQKSFAAAPAEPPSGLLPAFVSAPDAPSSPESSLGRNRGMEWLCGVDGMPVSARAGWSDPEKHRKKAQLVGDGAASPGLVTCLLLCRYRSWMLFRSPSRCPLTRSAGVPSCAGLLCARSLRLPAVSPPLAAPPPSDVPPRESTDPLPTRASSEAARRSCSVLCARLMRTMRPAPASRGWLWRGPSPSSSWGQFPRRPSIATFLRRSEASAPQLPRGFRGIGSSLASFLGRSDMERERLPLPDFSEGPPPGPRPRDIPVHGACVRGSRASGGSKKRIARRGGPPAFTRPGASSARAFVRDGLTSHPVASRPDPTPGRGVPTAAPPRSSSWRTNRRRATSAQLPAFLASSSRAS